MSTNIEAGRQIDTSVVVPAAILAGASRADQLIAAEQAKARGEAPPVLVQPQPEGKDALPPAPIQQQAPAPVLQPETPVPAPQPVPQQVAPEEWERRYRAMKGRHDAVVSSSQQALQEMQRQLEELRARGSAPPIPDPVQLDEEDDATWGPDLRNAIQRRVAAAVAEVEKRLTGRVQHVEHVAQAGTEEALRAQLFQMMPNWEDVNFDPQFHAWLALPDEMSGVRRQDLVNKAYGERNAHRVLKFFNSFLSEAAPAPAGGQQPAPLPVPNGSLPPVSQRLSLTDLAAPGPARPAAAAGTPAAPTVKRHWTSSEIGQFYAAKNRGLYNRTAEDRALCAAYEADIYAAQTEGRVSG